MRIFENSHVYAAYLSKISSKLPPRSPFDTRLQQHLRGRCNSLHFLLPILQEETSAFFTVGSDRTLQQQWAREHGMKANPDADAILLAQIEEHRTEVLYNLAPMLQGDDFMKKLPGCVRHTIAWHASPSPSTNLLLYDRVVSNFPRLLEAQRVAGQRVAYFFPGHDPEMDPLAQNRERPVDILFVGTYSRFHRRRAALLKRLVSLAGSYRVGIHLSRGRVESLADTPLGWLPPLSRYRSPSALRRISEEPIFGLDLYGAMSRSKIVLNVAVDMAGDERGNLRCFEAMGCGCLLLSDAGRYPEGMIDGETMVSYTTIEEAIENAVRLLADSAARLQIAARGHQAVAELYSKSRQWARFQELAS